MSLWGLLLKVMMISIGTTNENMKPYGLRLVNHRVLFAKPMVYDA